MDRLFPSSLTSLSLSLSAKIFLAGTLCGTSSDHITKTAGHLQLEFAQAMRRSGSRVTIIERNVRLLHREDSDVSAGLETLFHDEDICTRLGRHC